jgi:electron transport complex protein RnfA
MMNNLAALAVFSGLSINLMIHLGIGIRDFNREPCRPIRFIIFQCSSLFVSVVALWSLFSYIFSPLSLGFFEYFLLFPLVAGSGKLWESLFIRLFPPEEAAKRLFPVIGTYNALTTTALLVTMRLAGSFTEAVALALGFALGTLAALFLLRAILSRFSRETVPPLLRGPPLLLISAGLLALIFSSLSTIFFRLLKFY